MGFLLEGKDAMRRTWAWTAVAGVLVACCLAWWLAGDRGSEAARPQAHRSVASPSSAADGASALSSSSHVVEPALGADRESVAELATDVPSQSKEQAKLVVLALAKETRAPLAGIRIWIVLAPSAPASEFQAADVSPAVGDEGVLTDAEGRAEIAVPPDVALRVLAGDRSDRRARENRALEPLARGETREVELLLAISGDVHFVGRVVADESGAPLADAWVTTGAAEDLIALRPDPLAASVAGTATSFPAGPDGVFEVGGRSWENDAARIDAPGRAWILVELVAGHETRANAFEVRLQRSAALEILALGPARTPLAGARIRLSAKSYQVTRSLSAFGLALFDAVRWEAHCDLAGRARLEGLPPEVPFLLEAAASDADPLGVAAEPLPLQPGEIRTLEIQIGAGASVAGRMQRSDGTPVPGAEIWMQPWIGESSALFVFSAEDEVRTASTREGGDFSFADVPDGEWVLAPNPHGQVTAKPERVAVLDGLADRAPVLTAHDLFIAGKVVDADGLATSAHVMAVGKDGMRPLEPTDDGGLFSLGPLAPGTYFVQAMELRNPRARSARVEAQAGASDVVLELEAGGCLAGRVLDAGGSGVEAQVTVAPSRNASGQAGGISIASTAPDGTFRFEGLPPGSYCIAASTSGGECGLVADLALANEQRIEDLVLRVQPGGRMRVRYGGPDEVAQILVHSGTAVVALDGVERGTTKTWVVPEGTLQIECTERKGAEFVTREHEVTVLPGALAEVEFAPE
jgi:hypothetical protein